MLRHVIILYTTITATVLNSANGFGQPLPQQARFQRSLSSNWGSGAATSKTTTTTTPARPSFTRRQAFDGGGGGEPMLGGVGQAIDSFYQTQPYLSAFITCSVKAGTADFLSQTSADSDTEDEDESTAAVDAQHQQLPYPMASVEGTSAHYMDSLSTAVDTASGSGSSVDLSRNLAFIFYGGIYTGLVQQFIYSGLFPKIFGSEHTWQSVAIQVGLDMSLIGPFLCLPLAYIVKTVFTSDEVNMKNILVGLEKYVEDVKVRGLLFKYWALWIPVQTLTFGVIPEHYRVLFVASISFFWMFILSSVSSSTEDPSTDAATTTVEMKSKTKSTFASSNESS